MQSVRAAHQVEAARQPPQAIESEQAVLGALLLDPGAIDRIDWLPAASFFRAAHRIIYETLRALIADGKPLDVLVVIERLKRAEKLDDAGGAEYVGSLPLNTVTVHTIRRHAELVHEAAIRRQVITHAVEIADRAYGVEDARTIAEEAEDRFLSVLDTDRGARDAEPFGEAVAAALDWIDSPEQGISTGYRNIDRVWGGMRAGDLIVVAGRPSMGKSGLVMNIAEHVAEKVPVLAFSLEMTSRAIAARSVRYHQALIGRHDAVTHLMGLELWVDETPGIGAGYVRARAKRLKRAHGLGLIVVDYLQLMAGQGENRTQEVGSISRALKAIAKEFQIPVIAVSQLNRGAENRNDRRPIISDLRESGQLEQDADVIAMVYRDEYYQPETPLKGIAEILTRKHREGPTGTSYLLFESEHARFKNMDGPLPFAAEQERKPRRYTAGKKNSGGSTVVDFKKNSGADTE